MLNDTVVNTCTMLLPALWPGAILVVGGAGLYKCGRPNIVVKYVHRERVAPMTDLKAVGMVGSQVGRSLEDI